MAEVNRWATYFLSSGKVGMEVDTMVPVAKSPLDNMRGRGGKTIMRVRFTPKSRVIKKPTPKNENMPSNRVDSACQTTTTK